MSKDRNLKYLGKIIFKNMFLSLALFSYYFREEKDYLQKQEYIDIRDLVG